MLNKTPIKRNENIIKFSRDHHASLLFCWKIRQGVKHHIDIDRMLDYLRYFWTKHFAPHFGEEEAFLFAPLKDDKVLKAMDDHKSIKESIEALHATKLHGTEEKLLELADMVDEHVRYEERILFPHLESTLSHEQLKHIGTQISDEPLLDTYQDAFWKNPSSL
ncbi:MAG TPA: hemerythrin domain-containing protein [Hanamia sp.]